MTVSFPESTYLHSLLNGKYRRKKSRKECPGQLFMLWKNTVRLTARLQGAVFPWWRQDGIAQSAPRCWPRASDPVRWRRFQSRPCTEWAQSWSSRCALELRSSLNAQQKLSERQAWWHLAGLQVHRAPPLGVNFWLRSFLRHLLISSSSFIGACQWHITVPAWKKTILMELGKWKKVSGDGNPLWSKLTFYSCLENTTLSLFPF